MRGGGGLRRFFLETVSSSANNDAIISLYRSMIILPSQQSSSLSQIVTRTYAKAAKKTSSSSSSSSSSSKSKSSQGKRSGGTKKKGSGGMGEIKRDPKLDAALDKYINLLVKAIEPTEITEEQRKLSKKDLEEFEEKSKEYSRKKMAQHREMQKDLNDKIRLKAEACNALPEGFLRDHAWTEDHTLFSPKRRMPVATPPIEGYAENKLAADEAAVVSNVGLGKR